MGNKFLVGAATAAHQVEGNNIHSDNWVMENLEHFTFAERSVDAVDHYNKYEEDIKMLSPQSGSKYFLLHRYQLMRYRILFHDWTEENIGIILMV